MRKIFTLERALDDYVRNDNARIIVFTGAGISLASGQLSASQLIQHILTALGIASDEIDRLMRHRAFPPFEIIMYFFSQYLAGNISRLFLYGNPNSSHAVIGEIVMHRNNNAVITTNFDPYHEAYLPGIPVYRDETKPIPAKGPFIYKIHGSADEPESVRNTVRNITLKRNMDQRKERLREIFTDNYAKPTLLIFVGYSFSDELDINPLFTGTAFSNTTVIINHKQSNVCRITYCEDGLSHCGEYKQGIKNTYFKDCRVINICSDTASLLQTIRNRLYTDQKENSPVTDGTNRKKIIAELHTMIEKTEEAGKMLFSGVIYETVYEYDRALGYFKKAAKTWNRVIKKAAEAEIRNCVFQKEG
jgi:hypothetical protein